MSTSIGWRIKWTKDEKARCDFKGEPGRPAQALFAVGVDASHGRFENTGVMDAAKASFLWLIAGELKRGRSGPAAYEAAEAMLTDRGRERLNADTTPAVPATSETARNGPPSIHTPLLGDPDRRE